MQSMKAHTVLYVYITTSYSAHRLTCLGGVRTCDCVASSSISEQITSGGASCRLIPHPCNLYMIFVVISADSEWMRYKLCNNH